MRNWSITPTLDRRHADLHDTNPVQQSNEQGAPATVSTPDESLAIRLDELRQLIDSPKTKKSSLLYALRRLPPLSDEEAASVCSMLELSGGGLLCQLALEYALESSRAQAPGSWLKGFYPDEAAEMDGVMRAYVSGSTDWNAYVGHMRRIFQSIVKRGGCGRQKYMSRAFASIFGYRDRDRFLRAALGALAASEPRHKVEAKFRMERNEAHADLATALASLGKMPGSTSAALTAILPLLSTLDSSSETVKALRTELRDAESHMSSYGEEAVRLREALLDAGTRIDELLQETTRLGQEIERSSRTHETVLKLESHRARESVSALVREARKTIGDDLDGIEAAIGGLHPCKESELIMRRVALVRDYLAGMGDDG